MSDPNADEDVMSFFDEAQDLARRALSGDDEWPKRSLEAAQVAATLALVEELRTLNSDRSQWYREVLEVLTQAKESDGSLRSEQPAAAPDGPEGGKP